MLRRVTVVVVLAVVAVTAATVSYRVLTLPERGELRRPVVPFTQWAERNGQSRQAMVQQCETVNETNADRAWCLQQHLEVAQRVWRGSPEGMGDFWTASELSSKRDLYLVVGAYVLFALAVGLLIVRVIAQLGDYVASPGASWHARGPSPDRSG